MKLLSKKGENKYFYRAIDGYGDTVDFLLTAKKEIESARRFFKHSVKLTHIQRPGLIVTDKNKAYAPAIQSLKTENLLPARCRHVMDKHSNDYLESDHRFR